MSTLITVEIHLMHDEAQILADLADHLACTPLESIFGSDEDGASANLIMSHIKRQLLKLGVEPTRFKREREGVPDEGSRPSD